MFFPRRGNFEIYSWAWVIHPSLHVPRPIVPNCCQLEHSPYATALSKQVYRWLLIQLINTINIFTRPRTAAASTRLVLVPVLHGVPSGRSTAPTCANSTRTSIATTGWRTLRRPSWTRTHWNAPPSHFRTDPQVNSKKNKQTTAVLTKGEASVLATNVNKLVEPSHRVLVVSLMENYY